MSTRSDERAPIYLNNAATAYPRATGMSEVVARRLDQLPVEYGRSSAGGEDALDLCRQDIAVLLHFDTPERIVLTKNATEALNVAILGLRRTNSVVVTSSAEHNSVLRPLYNLENKQEASLHIVGCDDAGRVSRREWEDAVATLKPGLAILTHASNVTGAVNSAEELLGFARRHGAITILDASQTMGVLDIEMEHTGADILVFTGHKYLLGPQGTGGMAIKEGIDLAPLLVGGSGIRSDLREMPPQLPLKLEAGTPAAPLFDGLRYAVRWQREYPPPLREMDEMAQRLEAELSNLGATVVAVPGARTPTVAFTLPGWDLSDVAYILEKNFNIVCRTGLHCAPLIHRYIGTAPDGNIRFSLSRFTTPDELDTVLDAVGRIMYARR